MLKRLIPYFKPHKKLFFMDLIAAFSVAAIDLIFPLFSKNAINEYIPNSQMKQLMLVAIILLLLYVYRMGAQFFMSYWGHIMGARMEYDMRKELFAHLQMQDIAFYDQMRTGQIMNRMMSSLRDIAELCHHGPEDFFIAVVMIIGSFIILLRIHVELTLIIFLVLAILIVFAINKRKLMRFAMRDVRENSAQMNAKLENSISGIRLSKSFTNESFEEDDFDTYNERHLESRGGFYRAMGVFSSGTGFLTDILSLTTLVVGGYFVYKGAINYGELVAYILYANFFMRPVRKLIQFMQQYEEGITGFERFIEMMDISPNIQDAKDAKDLSDVQGEITFHDVYFAYNKEDEPVLDDFNLRIQPQKKVALVGASGVGKSTISKLLLRFYDVQEGSIAIDGNDLRSLKIKSLRENIGLVEQEVFMYYGTIKENIRYGRLDASDEEIVQAAKSANIHDLIMSLPHGYDSIVGERGVKLSGGQKQRVAIARLFLKNPKILILDEATSSLDNENERFIQKTLDQLSVGRTTLTIAHRLSTIINSDEIIVLSKEGVLERGTHAELLERNGEYAKLYYAQHGGHY